MLQLPMDLLELGKGNPMVGLVERRAQSCHISLELIVGDRNGTVLVLSAAEQKAKKDLCFFKGGVALLAFLLGAMMVLDRNNLRRLVVGKVQLLLLSSSCKFSNNAEMD